MMKNKKKKKTYLNGLEWRRLKLEEKMGVFHVTHKGNNNNFFYTIVKLNQIRYFVSEELYLNKSTNYLSQLKTATYRNVNAKEALKINANQIFIYEVLNHQRITKSFPPSKTNFFLPEQTKREWGNFIFDQEHYKFINSTFPDKLKKIILPGNANKVKKSLIQKPMNVDNF